MVTDRRLSSRGKPIADDAIKVATLDTIDGIAIIGYAGLGKTRKGTEPSEWMNSVLRGRSGITLEQAIGYLASAARNELSKHLTRGLAHHIIVPAFIRATGPRLYTIDQVVDRAGKHSYRYITPIRPDWGDRPYPLAAGGTGGLYLGQLQDRSWRRDLLNLIKKYEQGRVPERVVADRFAKLNYQTHLAVLDDSVGPRSIVVWRRRRDPRYEGSGGGHQFYSGLDRESTGSIPSIMNGMDVNSIVDVIMGQYPPNFTFEEFRDLMPNVEELNRLLRERPSEPDDELR
jgi:hypothetical protein